MTKIKILFLFVFTGFLSSAIAQQKFEWKEATSNGYTYKYVTNDPLHARFYTLKNGLTVILSPINKDPRIQCYVAVKAGSKTDPANNTGLAHYLEHMMFKGTDKYGTLNWAMEQPQLEKISALYEDYNHSTDPLKRKEIYHLIDSVSGVASKYSIANEYDKLMSAMGAQGTNAFTSFEQTVYTDDVPSSSINKYLAVQGERFRNPQFRIFHTELEAVYEEKNRSLDNDGSKVFEKLFAGLFKHHNYGLQTTIGTVEHLKNPSLVEIEKYYHKYYVPNNMGIIMSGDFNPDRLIKTIDKTFAYMESKPVSPYTFEKEAPITTPVVEEVVGPDAEKVTIGYRLPGIKSGDVLMASLVGQVLTNGKAGLMDLNLVKKQKMLRASAFSYSLIDYGMLILSGSPTSGQSLESVRDLMLGEINNLRTGNFDEKLLKAIVNNQKKDEILQSESYGSRASALMDAFTSELDWQIQVASVEKLSQITKQEVVDFAKKYFNDNNYVIVYKRKGVDSSIQKVEKPLITPVETNSKAQSAFVKMVDKMPEAPIAPVWVNYNTDIQKSKIGPAGVLYVPNKSNSIFRLYYRFDLGTYYNLKWGIAAQYLSFLGTPGKSAEDIAKDFYGIACSFKVSAGTDKLTVSIEGLQENFDKAVSLFEDLLSHCVADESALTSLKARISKSRTDAKLSKGSIMSGLTSYAWYGPRNPFNYTLSDEALNAITPAELVDMLHGLNKNPHEILYYGPQPIAKFNIAVKRMHKMPALFNKVGEKMKFSAVKQDKNLVLFASYDMVQAETRWIRNNQAYNPGDELMVNVFNNYFGSGMGALVFQTIRESKALAYSTFAQYIIPGKKEDPYTFLAYVGSQSDKFNDAVVAMNELIDSLPEIKTNFNLAKEGIKKDIETERIVEDGIIFNFLRAKDKGLNYDIRKEMYQNVGKVTFNQLKAFHSKYIAQKPYTYAIVASEDKLPVEKMARYGEVKKLGLSEIFGY
ncbi:MAG: insulinase family protein [Chitinophagaceae bacterium]|nr:insulinase family protein [Bacteroidota bacterium]MCC6257577.1 insulinase family protein [Chitinophagaceae bacterium]MCW5916698.1 insulinase family protein [Ferruginibacter sp.]